MSRARVARLSKSLMLTCPTCPGRPEVAWAPDARPYCTWCGQIFDIPKRYLRENGWTLDTVREAVREAYLKAGAKEEAMPA